MKVIKVTPVVKVEAQLILSLLGSPTDGALESHAYQRELEEVLHGLQDTGADVSPRIRVRKGEGFASILSGDFQVVIKSLGPPAFTFLGIWLKAKYGRKVRLKVDGVEAVASSVAEVEELIKITAKFRDRSHDGDGGA